jgi:hypothetical protein
MVMVALAIFQSWIWVGVVIGKFVIDLGFGNFFNTKTTWPGSMLSSGWLVVLFHYNIGLNFVID